MTHMPGVPVEFDPPSEWRPCNLLSDGRKRQCRYGCGSTDVLVREHESSDGAYEDYEYKCRGCGKTWWVDGIDS